jgi:hypothetical protein
MLSGGWIRSVARLALAGLALVVVLRPASAETPTTYLLPPATPAGKLITATGTLQVNVKFTLVDIPDGTQLNVQVIAGCCVSDLVNGGSNTIDGTATVSGGQAKLQVVTPYSWPAPSASEQVFISVYATASYTSADGAVSNQDSGAATATIPLPKNGSTTPVSIATSL